MDDDKADEQSAFNAGYESRRRGAVLDDNPHDGDTIEHEWWSDGWRRAEQKMNKRPPLSGRYRTKK